MSEVSIHAPVKERRFLGSFNADDYGFNSRSREGATRLGGFDLRRELVSIHAPVKERQIASF